MGVEEDPDYGKLSDRERFFLHLYSATDVLARHILAVLVTIAVIVVIGFFAWWGYHQWWVATHCTQVLGTTVCQ